MKKGIGYYMRSYLKNNALVLFFELVVIVLLALVCTVLLGGQPVWLGPAMALVAYLLAEMRFMMAYVASNVNKEAKEEEKETEEDDVFGEQASEPDDDLSYDEYTPPAPISETTMDQERIRAEWDDKPVEVHQPQAMSDAKDLDDDLDLPAKSTLDLGE